MGLLPEGRSLTWHRLAGAVLVLAIFEIPILAMMELGGLKAPRPLLLGVLAFLIFLLSTACSKRSAR